MRWRQLALIAAVEVLGMSLWFSASAVVPSLRVAWDLSNSDAAWLTVSVQAGFILGALASAVLNLADRVPLKTLVAVSAVGGAVANAAFAVLSDDLASGIVLRALTGVALAGVYPPGMKLVASWFEGHRGFAIGVLVGALAIGSGTPHLINAVTTLPWQEVVLVSSGLSLVSAVMVLLFVHEGPFRASAPPLVPAYAARLVQNRGVRLVNFGYIGHMWELYAFWTWLPSYVAATYSAWEPGADSRVVVGLTSFCVIAAAGFAGCVIGGKLSDRYGRGEITMSAMVISACGCLMATAVFGLNPVIVWLLLLVWGVAVIADSAQFSTSLTEIADKRYVGTALTVQTALGFFITTISILLLPVVADAVGWQYAFAVLAIGPALGALSMGRARVAGLIPRVVRGSESG
jgi:MFS family permease